MKHEITEFIPEQVIGGQIPCPSGADPVEAAWNSAALAFDTEKVLFIHAIHEGTVYFLAAPGKSFASHPHSGTGIAMALPGMPEFKGTGIYAMRTPIGTVALIITDLGDEAVKIGRSRYSLKCIMSDYGRVTDMAGAQGYPLYDMEGQPPIPWHGFEREAEAHSRKMINGIASTCASVLIIAIGLWGFAGIQRGMLKAENEMVQEHTRSSSTMLIEALNSAKRSGGSAEYRRFLSITRMVMDMEGRLVEYVVDTREHKLKAELPAFADLERLRKLGGKMEVNQLPSGTISVSITGLKKQ